MLAGALKLTEIAPLAPVLNAALVFVGLPGKVAKGVTLPEALEDVPVPMALVAVTVKV